MMTTTMPDAIVFHDDHVWTEGAGAKWRYVKYGLWFTLRLRHLLLLRSSSSTGQPAIISNNHTATNKVVPAQAPVVVPTVMWLPNPAQMMNPHLPPGVSSTMGGLGIVRPGAPPPVLVNRTSAWLRSVVLGDGDDDDDEDCLGGGTYYRQVNVELRSDGDNGAAEERAIRSILESSSLDGTGRRNQDDDDGRRRRAGVALILHGPSDSKPLHHHGPIGAWLHHAFYSHRLERSSSSSPLRSGGAAGPRSLPRPGGTDEGTYLISIHVRHYEEAEWNLPPSYYVSAVDAILDAVPILDCRRGDGAAAATTTNSATGDVPRRDRVAIFVIGDETSPVLPAVAEAFGSDTDCLVHLEPRNVVESYDEPMEDFHAQDDYDPDVDDVDDVRRKSTFRDLEVMGLSDFFVTSNSEFSALAQSLSHPSTIVLCPPRRPGRYNVGPPCDMVGTPNAILTAPDLWGEDAVESSDLTGVDGPHVRREVTSAWMKRGGGHGGEGDVGDPGPPLWDVRPDHGIVPFDIEGTEIEASWPDVGELWHRPHPRSERGRRLRREEEEWRRRQAREGDGNGGDRADDEL